MSEVIEAETGGAGLSGEGDYAVMPSGDAGLHMLHIMTKDAGHFEENFPPTCKLVD